MAARQGNNHQGTPRRTERAWQLAAVVLALAVGGLGCNPITTVGFLVAPFFPNTTDPACPLTIPDKEAKVAIICAHEDLLAPNPAFRDADQIVCRLLATALTHRFKENKDKVTIVPATKVYNYVQANPTWITLSKRELAKKLDADTLVYLELGQMSMIEQGSIGTLYRGNAQVHITVFDLQKPDGESIKFEHFHSCTYPTTHPEDSTSMPPAQFRAKFFDRIARDLAFYFVAHPAKEKKMPE